MSDTVITIENLSKKYTIHRQNARYRDDGLRHVLEDAALAPWRWLRKTVGLNGTNSTGSSHSPTPHLQSSTTETFWALREVSFEVKKGEVVGIIGRNGAGKSTLLKVLSRITEPTAGCVRMRGRVASLLEVGTGFHQELTGRENIFLNGAILGMPRSEIIKKFDEIVAFAEIERFLDTPVKRYSSGMYVRLAFSVAAHLEPDILIIDEVLAVGDSQFQTKCLGKIENVAASDGRTVLLVSHNMGIISRLCKRSLLLDQGRLSANDDTHKLIARHLSNGAATTGSRLWSSIDPKWCSAGARPCAVRILNSQGDVTAHVAITEPVIVELDYQILYKVRMLRVALRFFTSDGTLAFMGADSSSPDFATKQTVPGTYICRCILPANLLNEGRYFVTVSADIPLEQVVFHEEHAISFTVEQTGGVSSRFAERWPGAVCPRLEWQTREPFVPARCNGSHDPLTLSGTREN